MRLTKQTNYAIRMMMYCDSNDGLSRVSDIAGFYNLSEQFLLKILQILTKAGFVESIRGRNGGIRLALPAEELGLGEIIRVTEDNFAMAECFEGGENVCPLVNKPTCSFAARCSKTCPPKFLIFSRGDTPKSRSFQGLVLRDFTQKRRLHSQSPLSIDEIALLRWAVVEANFVDKL